MAELLPDLLKRSAELHGDRPALRAGDREWTHARLDELTDRIAATLQRMEPVAGRVGLLLPNHPLFAALLHGVLRAGSRAVMINPQYSRREAGEVVADAGVGTVITVEALAPLLPTTVRRLLVETLPASLRAVTQSGVRDVALAEEAPAATAAVAADEAVVVFTAATTGRARGARLSHGNLRANAASTVEAMRLTPDDRVLGVLPFVHLFGQTVTLNAPLAAGACVVPVERFNPVRVLELLEQERITVICGVPAIFAALAAAAARRGVLRHRLRVAISGGSPLPAEVRRQWEARFGLSLREGYGLTEAGPVCLFNRVDRPNHAGTLGYPFPAVEVTIRDPTGAELPSGEVGEICVRGANVFLGYLGEDDRAESGFHGDWLRTGDLGSRAPSGVIRYRGLLKSMFTRSGFNVYPAEIARVLEADPRIRRVRVCSLPDPTRENEIVLIVEAEPGKAPTDAEVRELCRERLAGFKQPTRVEIETPPAGAPAKR